MLESGASTVGTYDLYNSGRYVERPAALVTGGTASSSEVVSPFFEMPRPVFESKTYSRVDAVKDFQVPNDGVTDATSKLQAAQFSGRVWQSSVFAVWNLSHHKYP